MTSRAGLSRRPVLAFDAIVCRNVLIYIDRPVAVAIVARLATYLRPGLPAAQRRRAALAWLSGLLCEDPDFKDSVLLPGSGVR